MLLEITDDARRAPTSVRVTGLHITVLAPNANLARARWRAQVEVQPKP